MNHEAVAIAEGFENYAVAVNRARSVPIKTARPSEAAGPDAALEWHRIHDRQ
jgi:hypothetical protein